MNLINSRRNGGYTIELFEDGTLLRHVNDASIPPEYPEHADLKITDFCDAGCGWCHESSTTKGLHGDSQSIVKMISTFPAGTEIAIGGGNPMAHPDLDYILSEFRDAGIISNITVNAKHFDAERPRLDALCSQKLLYGVGVSVDPANPKLPEWDYPHLVAHLIIGIHHPSILDEDRRMNILALGYKTFGRGGKFKEIRPQSVSDMIASWYREIAWIVREFPTSFDNLAIEQLKVRRLFADQKEFDRKYMGHEGEFSMYIDGVSQTFAVSSYSEKRHPWENDVKTMFSRVRETQRFPIIKRRNNDD